MSWWGIVDNEKAKMESMNRIIERQKQRIKQLEEFYNKVDESTRLYPDPIDFRSVSPLAR